MSAEFYRTFRSGLDGSRHEEVVDPTYAEAADPDYDDTGQPDYELGADPDYGTKFADADGDDGNGSQEWRHRPQK